jgi:hypothetical protein
MKYTVIFPRLILSRNKLKKASKTASDPDVNKHFKIMECIRCHVLRKKTVTRVTGFTAYDI